MSKSFNNKCHNIVFLRSQIDILVNNAAKGAVMKIKDTPIEVDKEIIDIVVVAQVSLTKAVLPQFLKQQSGHVVVTSSMAGKVGKSIIMRYITAMF